MHAHGVLFRHKEIMLLAGKWMELETFKLSETSPAKKDKYLMLSFGLKKKKKKKKE
jgi:hypothetical protein